MGSLLREVGTHAPGLALANFTLLALLRSRQATHGFYVGITPPCLHDHWLVGLFVIAPDVWTWKGSRCNMPVNSKSRTLRHFLSLQLLPTPYLPSFCGEPALSSVISLPSLFFHVVLRMCFVMPVGLGGVLHAFLAVCLHHSKAHTHHTLSCSQPILPLLPS